MIYAYRDNGRWVIASLMPRFKGIGGWHTLTDAERAKHGWYPCVEVNAQFDPVTQIRSPAEFTLSERVVTATYTIWDKPESQVAMETMAKAHAAINAERDRRLAADFTFNGKQFQRDATSLARITGAATLAGFAVAQGSPAGNLRWANPDRDFEWIASDDTRVPMDAQTAFDFGAAAARVETTLIYAGSALRAMSPIPADFTDDKWWT